MAAIPLNQTSRYAGWLPGDDLVYADFMQFHFNQGVVRSGANGVHQPAVAQFETAINADQELRALFDLVFIQARQLAQSIGVAISSNLREFLYSLDGIIVSAPSFHVIPGNIVRGVPIGVPVYLLFDILSNTSAAYDLFRKPAFNQALGALLDDWGRYLTTPASNSTLNTGANGWFSLLAIQMLEENRGNFDATYVVPNPQAPDRGFTSWDHFFTREVQLNARPVHEPNNPTLLHSACESTVYNIAFGVREHDSFWIKGRSYSLFDMLNHDTEHARMFNGGTVYQAFLSPQDYHRWHAPIDGTVVKTVLVPGTYYAVLPDDGAEANDPDLPPGDPRGALIRSQGWLNVSSARALIFIQADNKDVGLMAFIGVGMAEVSTCEITVREGTHVRTGDHIGMFHFGGSSHTLIFGPNVKVTFADNVQVGQHLWVNSIIGQFTANQSGVQGEATA